MQQENINKKAQKKFEDFLEHRKNMPDSDKKLALGAVIEQIGAINVDKAFEKVNLQICRSGKKVRLRPYLTRIAAVLTLPLLAFTIWSLFIQEKATPKYTELTWQELSSPSRDAFTNYLARWHTNVDKRPKQGPLQHAFCQGTPGP